MILDWHRLRGWIDENRDTLRQKRKIEAAAEEWYSKGRSKDYLLQGKPLKEAKAFQQEQAGDMALSDLARDFIQESIQQRRNSRINLIGFGLFIPLGLALVLGIVAAR